MEGRILLILRPRQPLEYPPAVQDVEELLISLNQGPAVLVTLAQAQGSSPRAVGAWMAVCQDHQIGSIGGGQLELRATEHARSRLQSGANAPESLRYPLGPSLGQCCGGVVHLRYESIDGRTGKTVTARLAIPLAPVALFGAGHVGQALVRVLAELPLALAWFDSREGAFPPGAPAVCEQVDMPDAAVPALAPGSRVLVMSHSHAEDFDLIAACLARRRARGDLPFIGLIGSHSKWASFRQRLAARGFTEAELAQVCCPIGVPGIAGKQPGVIAVAVAAQLLQELSAERARA